MAKKSEHGEIIVRAATARLAPLGCLRKGRSRIWLSDQGAWAIVIEFQPSGFLEGSYLNVAPCWLWYPKDHLTFDYGPVRFNGLVQYKDTRQFQAEAEALVEQAAQAVARFRQELETPASIVAKLTALADGDTRWRAYHAGVAAGLIGDAGASLRLFAQIVTAKDRDPSFAEFQNFCAELASKLSDPTAFREAILAIISRTRMANKLPEDPACINDWRARAA